MDDLGVDGAVDRIRANAAYTYRIPDPHRVNVPPPVFADEGEATITVGNIVPQHGFDLSFLSSIPIDHLYHRNMLLTDSWSYDRRRSATKILPYLYLGPMTAAKDREALRSEGITMILGVAHRSSFTSLMAAGPMKAATELGLDKQLIEVADNSELIAAFPKAVQAINQHLVNTHERISSSQSTAFPSTRVSAHAESSSDTKPVIDPASVTGKVLVFCESGNERSAAVVAAYLIHMFEGVDHIKACQLVNTRRFSTCFDDGLKQYLFSYYSIIKARRDVAATIQGSNASSPSNEVTNSTDSRPKRAFDDTVDDDGDVDMEMEDDIERFGGRSFTPFQDDAGLETRKRPLDRS